MNETGQIQGIRLNLVHQLVKDSWSEASSIGKVSMEIRKAFVVLFLSAVLSHTATGTGINYEKEETVAGCLIKTINNARSVFDCAGICFRDELCETIIFTEADGTCDLMKKSVEPSSVNSTDSPGKSIWTQVIVCLM